MGGDSIFLPPRNKLKISPTAFLRAIYGRPYPAEDRLRPTYGRP